MGQFRIDDKAVQVSAKMLVLKRIDITTLGRLGKYGNSTTSGGPNTNYNKWKKIKIILFKVFCHEKYFQTRIYNKEKDPI